MLSEVLHERMASRTCVLERPQAFERAIKGAGLPEEWMHFELFDAGHGGIGYRYPLALAWLAQRIASVDHARGPTTVPLSGHGTTSGRLLSLGAGV